MIDIRVDKTVHCEGLSCPMPVVRTKKAIDEIAPGQVLEVIATDRGSLADLKGWAQRVGHYYLGVKEENGKFHHYIRRARTAEEKPEMRFPHTASNEELAQKLAAGENVKVLDVREPAEYAFGHIPGAVNMPLGQLEEKLSMLDPNKTYYVICRTGSRSDLACQLLDKKGFAHVKNVIPGMAKWEGSQWKTRNDRGGRVNIMTDKKKRVAIIASSGGLETAVQSR